MSKKVINTENKSNKLTGARPAENINKKEPSEFSRDKSCAKEIHPPFT